jgi:hypothetical protein
MAMRSRRAAHFRAVGGPFGRVTAREATVTIVGGSVRVRPLRARRDYELPLDVVAKWIVERVTKAELFRARTEKARARAERRRGR